MRKQIKEVENYFVNKITACDFTIEKISTKYNDWTEFEVLIDDDYRFNFSVYPPSKVYCFFRGFMEIIIPDDRLENLINLIEENTLKIKAEKINALKEELSKLEAV